MGWGIFTIVTFAIGVWLALWLSSKRVLLVAEMPFDLLSPDSTSARSQFRVVSADGVPIDRPVGLSLKLRNVGAREISQQDYEEPLMIVAVGSKILSVKCEPDSRHQVARVSVLDDKRSSATLNLGSLNRRESVAIQMLLDGRPSELRATCRIAGQTNRGITRQSLEGYIAATMALCSAALAALFTFGLLSSVIRPNNSVDVSVWAFGVLVIAGTLLSCRAGYKEYLYCCENRDVVLFRSRRDRRSRAKVKRTRR